MSNLEKWAQFEALLFDLSIGFAALPAAKDSALIADGLRRVVEFLELDWSVLVEFPSEHKANRAMHVYIVPNDELISVDAEWEVRIASLMELAQSGVLMLPRLPDDLPVDAKREREYCQEVSLKSGLVIPLTVGGLALGMLGLGSRQREGAWSDDVAPRLQIIGQIFANVLLRKRMETRLQTYPQHLEALVADKVRELELARIKVIQTTKLAALGEMATGVAHELNQPLTAMLFEAEYLKEVAHQALDVASGDDGFFNAAELYDIADNLIHDIMRLRRITDYLRAFNDVFTGSVVRVDLNRAIENSFTLIEARLRQHGITVERCLGADLPWVLANPHKMEQVFADLISNAEYALEEMERRVKAHEVTLQGYEKALQISTGVEDSHVVVRVRDNGCGIPKSVQSHIFEPFFTTKPIGRGNGLGLPTCHEFVTEYGGQLTFESKENFGTTFTVSFPIAVRVSA